MLSEQIAQQEFKAIKQSNQTTQGLKLPSNRKGHYKQINSNEKEEAYKQVFNDPMTETYRKEA